MLASKRGVHTTPDMKRHAEAYDLLLAKASTINDKIQALPATATASQREPLGMAFNSTMDAADREFAFFKEAEEMSEARGPAARLIAKVENGRRPAGSLYVDESLTYHRNASDSNGRTISFFGDMLASRSDPSASSRLMQHAAEMQVEYRDVTTGQPGAGSFLPPVYLAEQWIESARPGRPFADALASMPLPQQGQALDFPRVQTQTAVAAQTEGAAVQETDIDSETYSVPKRTIAGQNDVTRQALEFSWPGLDEVIFRDLMADYDSELDSQLFSGNGSAPNHQGMRTLAGINSITYTSGSPTGAELVKKIYNAISDVASNRLEGADLVVMHPRRAAWLGASTNSAAPVFQQGDLNQAFGQQSGGFSTSFGGLRVVLDGNISTTLGASTSEDEVFVVRSSDLILAEGPIQVKVYEGVLSSDLKVRLQVYGFSAAALGRFPKAIARISGTGLVTPSFA